MLNTLAYILKTLTYILNTFLFVPEYTCLYFEYTCLLFVLSGGFADWIMNLLFAGHSYCVAPGSGHFLGLDTRHPGAGPQIGNEFIIRGRSQIKGKD